MEIVGFFRDGKFEDIIFDIVIFAFLFVSLILMIFFWPIVVEQGVTARKFQICVWVSLQRLWVFFVLKTEKEERRYRCLEENTVAKQERRRKTGQKTYVKTAISYVTVTADMIANRDFGSIVSGNASFIEIYAFRGCSSLTAVNFPNCTSIGSSAFGYCSSLTTDRKSVV